MKKSNLFLALSLISLLIYSGCGSSGKGVQTSLLNGKWILQTLNNKEVVAEKSGGEIPYLSFNIKLNSVTGSTGCNIINGKTDITGIEITFSDMSMTKINCTNAEYEMEFVNFIFHANPLQYKISNNILTISKNDKIIMTFRKS